MRISKVKWKNHPVLGNLELDFMNNQTGLPYGTIIFAGENGTGKTTILKTISDFLGKYPMDHFDYIKYVIGDKTYTAFPPPDESSLMSGYFDIRLPDGNELKVNTGKSGPNMWRSDPKVDNDIRNIRFYGSVYSSARANFRTNTITSITTRELDETQDYSHDSRAEEDFTSLKQLIIDIDDQDSKEYTELNKEVERDKAISWVEFYPKSKMQRFSNAFDNFFEDIKYSRVENLNGRKEILFKKEDIEIPIDSLSTGEKQIVFRGASLLKNLGNLNGSVIFVDEPEMSMHPRWERKILGYYQDIFIDPITGKSRAQLFFASHSEHVIASALMNKSDNLVIVLYRENGTLKARRIDAPISLPSITSAEVNYLAFDICTTDYHIELFSALQQKINVSKIKKCDDYIVNSKLYNPKIHEKESQFKRTRYNSLCVYIRNAIDHPESGNTFSDIELKTSIELLRKLL
jgi:hypothetical protein